MYGYISSGTRQAIGIQEKFNLAQAHSIDKFFCKRKTEQQKKEEDNDEGDDDDDDTDYKITSHTYVFFLQPFHFLFLLRSLHIVSYSTFSLCIIL